jgi:hypothetical protein
MRSIRVVVFAMGLLAAVQSIAVPPLIASAQTVGELTSQCDDAYTAERWTDVVDICTKARAALAKGLSNLKALTDADMLASDEVVIVISLQIAHAYAQLGDLKNASGNIKLARLVLGAAKGYGLSSDSKKYRSLEDAIDNEAENSEP